MSSENKLWAGRFAGGTAKNADIFNDSLPFDRALWKQDITASIAHAHMLGHQQIISEDECNSITAGLESIYKDIESGALIMQGAEDIHSFVENELVKRIGDAGKKLHTARSRNDQVATDFRLYVRDTMDATTDALVGLVKALLALAEKGTKYIMPGYTHLRKAQPMCAGHFWNAYAEMFLRDLDRMADSRIRMNIMPLGSGALAGTSYTINRFMVADELGFERPCDNSLDGVSDRDYVCEYLFDGSLIMSHLSRLCEDIILYTTEEFGYFEIADEYSTGSSIMPQKKNPDIPELMRGKTGRVYGHLMAMLTTLKGIPLAYDKDLQEDKEGFFDAEKQVISCVSIMAEMLGGISYKPERMAKAAEGEFCCATDVADYLAKKGMPFRSAHGVVGAIVRDCIQNGKTLQTMSTADYKAFSDLFEDDILEIVKGKNCAYARSSFGGASPLCVRENIQSIKKRLKAYED
ncbi:MAG: argininosuccinate lyase [Clostridia bacterium]|nr:argininosuccinate lyase [Clostridia bacterium]